MTGPFVRASRLYDVSSGNVVAHPATQATDEQIRRAVELGGEGR